MMGIVLLAVSCSASLLIPIIYLFVLESDRKNIHEGTPLKFIEHPDGQVTVYFKSLGIWNNVVCGDYRYQSMKEAKNGIKRYITNNRNLGIKNSNIASIKDME